MSSSNGSIDKNRTAASADRRCSMRERPYFLSSTLTPHQMCLSLASPLAPVEAVPGALQSIRYAWQLVTDKRARTTGVSADTAKAVAETLEYAIDLLIRGRSPRKPGRPPELKRKTVIAFVLSPYTSLTWPEIADRLFVVNGACTRCGLPKHAYLAGSREDFQTPCVNVLLTEYNLLKRELTKQQIPLPQISSGSMKEN